MVETNHLLTFCTTVISRDPDSRISTTILTEFSRMLDDFREFAENLRPQFVEDRRWYTENLIHFMVLEIREREHLPMLLSTRTAM